jgi:hypothetical protein
MMDWFFYGFLPIVGGILLYFFIKGLVNQDNDKKDKE